MLSPQLTELASAAAFMGGLGALLAALLAAANRFFWVYEDPRIGAVEEQLPANNCGACGAAGCRAFAEALVAGDMTPGQCTVAAVEVTGAIARLLGVSADRAEKRVARLACAGGNHVAWLRAHYQGLSGCRAAVAVGAGPKSCGWGCVGLGDCVTCCTFDALRLDAHGLPQVDSERCTACGDCVEACPKHLFSLQPVSHRLWVACNNRLHGDDAEQLCEVACTGCEKCVKDAPSGVVSVRDNLAVIDYRKLHAAASSAIERCASGARVCLPRSMRISESGR